MQASQLKKDTLAFASVSEKMSATDNSRGGYYKDVALGNHQEVTYEVALLHFDPRRQHFAECDDLKA